MKKYINILLIFTVCIALVLMVIYVIGTKDNYDRKLFFSPRAATKNWGVKANNFFEYLDENFYIQFDSNHNIKSVKKYGLFWVRNNYDGFPFDDEINRIRSVEINDNFYIYGVTKYENVKTIKLVDVNSNEKDVEFESKWLSDEGALCFCAKIPTDTLILSYEIIFIDQNGNIISDSIKNQNQQLQTYIERVQKDLSLSKYIKTSNKGITLNKYASSKNKVQERFYLIRDGKEFFLQEVSQHLNIYFLEENLLITEQIKVLQITLDDSKQSLYSTTYEASYDDEFMEFKNLILKSGN